MKTLSIVKKSIIFLAFLCAIPMAANAQPAGWSYFTSCTQAAQNQCLGEFTPVHIFNGLYICHCNTLPMEKSENLEEFILLDEEYIELDED